MSITFLIVLTLVVLAVSCILATQDVKHYGWSYVFCLVWPFHLALAAGAGQYLIWPQPEAARMTMVLLALGAGVIGCFGFFFFDAKATLRKR